MEMWQLIQRVKGGATTGDATTSQCKQEALVYQEAAARLEATQPGQTSGKWEAEAAVYQEAAVL